MMRTFWQRLRCTLAGHPITVSELETFDGQYWGTFDRCACGQARRPAWPGYLKKLQRDVDFSVEQHKKLLEDLY